MSLDQLLKDHKVLVCCGSGGVGKTTLSAALGVRAAQLGRRVLVLTIDPARRLANALGLKSFESEEIKVPMQNFDGELFASMIDSQQVFDEFVRKCAPNSEAAHRILNNSLYKTLSTTLSGSQEYTSLERLFQASQCEKYDLIVLDTPPAQHARDFLTAPQRFYSLFQDSIVSWFLRPFDQPTSFFSSMVNRGTQVVLKALETLTGAQFMKEMTEFFLAIHSLKDIVSEHSIAIHKLLNQTSSAFIVITSFDESKLAEAVQFQSDLERGGYSLGAVIVNRAFPQWIKSKENFSSAESESLKDLGAFYEELSKHYNDRNLAYDNFEKSISREVLLVRVPDLTGEIQDLEGLLNVAAVVTSS